MTEHLGEVILFSDGPTPWLRAPGDEKGGTEPITIGQKPMTNPRENTVQEVAARLAEATPPRLLDVREQGEFDIVHLEGGQLLTEALVGEMLESWPLDSPIVCYCHHGVRSVQAAQFLAGKGFTDVTSMAGGIEAWALQIDPKLPRY